MRSRLSFATFPPGDRAFAAFVKERWARALAQGDATPDGLQAALRTWHTRALVRPRTSLAGFGDGELWYVYRDGRSMGTSAETWWEVAGTARVEFDASGRFLFADAAACALVERSPAEMAVLAWRDLVPEAARGDDAGWLWAELEQAGVIQSVFDCPMADGTRRVIEYRCARLAGADGFEGHWRELALIDAEGHTLSPE